MCATLDTRKVSHALPVPIGETHMKRNATKIRGKDFCSVEVTLENGRLSISGSAGYILTTAKARNEALSYWRSYFEDAPEERSSMADKFGVKLSTALQAAKFVLETDGEFHGLDVVREDDSKVFVGHSFGQITEELKSWFPALSRIHAKWHLNDMHAECEHQEARGESYSTHPSAQCPDCGYVLGSAWLSRKLPADIESQIESAISSDLNGN